jgi:hypothetical protein
MRMKRGDELKQPFQTLADGTIRLLTPSSRNGNGSDDGSDSDKD